jgi:hypothetical protein
MTGSDNVAAAPGHGAAAGTLLLALLATSPAAGQVNIESLRRDSVAGTSGSLEAEFVVRTGNVEIVLLGLGGRVDFGGERTSAFVVGNGELGFQGGRRFSNSALLHVRQNYAVSPRVVLETFQQLDYDRARRLTFRGLLGAGPRLSLARSGGWRVALGTAYMFEHEWLDLPDTAVHPVRTSAHRWSNYLSAVATLRGGSTVAITVYTQPQLSDFDDTRVLGDARLVARLGTRVSATMSLNLRYDSRPPDGIRDLDATLRNGLAIAF